MTVRNLSERSPNGPGIQQDPPRAGSGRDGSGRVGELATVDPSTHSPRCPSTSDVGTEGVGRAREADLANRLIDLRTEVEWHRDRLQRAQRSAAFHRERGSDVARVAAEVEEELRAVRAERVGEAA